MIAVWKRVNENLWEARWNGVDLRVERVTNDKWAAWAGATRHRTTWRTPGAATRAMDGMMTKILLTEVRSRTVRPTGTHDGRMLNAQ